MRVKSSLSPHSHFNNSIKELVLIYIFKARYLWRKAKVILLGFLSFHFHQHPLSVCNHRSPFYPSDGLHLPFFPIFLLSLFSLNAGLFLLSYLLPQFYPPPLLLCYQAYKVDCLNGHRTVFPTGRLDVSLLNNKKKEKRKRQRKEGAMIHGNVW